MVMIINNGVSNWGDQIMSNIVREMQPPQMVMVTHQSFVLMVVPDMMIQSGIGVIVKMVIGTTKF